MQASFYGMHTNYQEPQPQAITELIKEDNLTYIIPLAIIGTILVTGTSYYAYRLKYPKKPTFEQI